ncbi:ATP-binding protein [Acanthopleuribacter pedis]|uniref:ATP-binding protein n=1 Tax=Acanthopleuribacter pedis TaxID=442870 RepID=A0A8J7QC20_9BACT|nr:ATP-binding protein [Acanthopleuribacter pedis]MBO1318236.1 ATP-binding protein [Acanthopleuribacter pedis]
MEQVKKKRIRPRERDAVIQSLRAGVTPRAGIQHIQVGRRREIEAMLKDIERIGDGGTAFRLIIGAYGSGKSFFLQLVRLIAQEKGLVTVHADLSPDRRLHATGGQARGLFAELMKNAATRAKPAGNALPSIVERFLTEAAKEADQTGSEVEAVIHQRLEHLSELVGGYDFAKVIAAYREGHETDNHQLTNDAVRWLRGEFSTKTDARKQLGVRVIIDDARFYDQLKLLSLFVRQAGYKGLLVNLDEMVNLYKLNNKKARESNYEQILRMLNDSLQGGSEGLGFLMGGTPEFLLDPRKGLYSYEALQSRLAENRFANQAGVVDYSATALHLANLTPEELYLLLCNIRHVFAAGDPANYLLPDEALTQFLSHCANRIGEAYFRTPRNTIKAFVDLLSLLEQDQQLDWGELIGRVELKPELQSDMPDSTPAGQGDDELSSFQL